MAKTPGTPKAKTGAPAQFDMNSRERKGSGKGGHGGPGRGRDEKRAPSHIISLPPTKAGLFRSSARLTRRLTPPWVRNTT